MPFFILKKKKKKENLNPTLVNCEKNLSSHETKPWSAEKLQGGLIQHLTSIKDRVLSLFLLCDS